MYTVSGDYSSRVHYGNPTQIEYTGAVEGGL